MATNNSRESALEQARNTMGALDLSAYNKSKSLAKQNYNTSVLGYKNAYDKLKADMEIQRKASSKDLSEGVGVLNDTYLNKVRNDINRYAASATNPVSTSNISTARNLMEMGNQQSKLYNTYYKALEGINDTLSQGQKDYDLALESARNAYDKELADIALGKQNARNSYNAQVAQLAEAIQSRWDTYGVDTDTTDTVDNTANINTAGLDLSNAWNNAVQNYSNIVNNGSTFESRGALEDSLKTFYDLLQSNPDLEDYNKYLDMYKNLLGKYNKEYYMKENPLNLYTSKISDVDASAFPVLNNKMNSIIDAFNNLGNSNNRNNKIAFEDTLNNFIEDFSKIKNVPSSYRDQYNELVQLYNRLYNK